MPQPTLTRPELETLRALRARFLANAPAEGGYWRSTEELALYDRTFAERIGWKWDTVLRELGARGWRPASRTVLDWGCGSGIAGRRVLAAWPGHFSELALHDLSPLACDFARAAATEAFPAVRSVPSVHPSGHLLLVSHVLNELSDPQLEDLLRIARQAREIIWVESGTHANSRRLVAEVRERLVGSGEFAIVAPCTHRERCGLFAPGNDRHWCHTFAPTPREIFQDAAWMSLGRELSIDLRATPLAFLVMQRASEPPRPIRFTPSQASHRPENENENENENSGQARVIGRPRDYKGYSKLLSCEASGVYERMLQKRDAPALLKEVQQGGDAPLYTWQLSAGRIVGGNPAGKPLGGRPRV